MATLYSKKVKILESSCKCGVKLTNKQKRCDKCIVKTVDDYKYWTFENNNSQSKTALCKSSWCNTTKVMAKNRDICIDCWIKIEKARWD